MSFRYQHGDRPLEGYTILRGIGRGGFGEVYYAVSDGGREVALKVVQENHEIELRGIQHCINLKSPHLVSIFDVRTNAEGTPFVIMEYVAGPSIRDILRAAPEGLGTEKAVFLLREIARGLGYLHDRGVVHRDLKPENIFFEDGYVKIGDYGLSKYIAVSRQSGQTISVGTVHYMAPEIGSGNYSRGIDIYSLGVIFYEFLTGRVPFEGSSMGEILLKHLTAEPDLSPVPEALRPVAARALAKSPKDRFASAPDFAEAALDASDFRRRLEGFDPANLSAHPGLAAGAQPARPGTPERAAPPP
ncbi:MAG: serine/threonine-protein kinase, partial [Planctomycetota bacterium]